MDIGKGDEELDLSIVKEETEIQQNADNCVAIKISELKEPPSKAQCCGRKFLTAEAYEVHLSAYHKIIRSITCSICSQKFDNVNLFHKHKCSVKMRVLNRLNPMKRTEILPLPLTPVVPQKKIMMKVTKSISKTYSLSNILKCNNCPRNYVNLKYYYKHIESCSKSKESKSKVKEC